MFVVSFSANEQSKFFALAGKFPFDLFAAYDFLKKHDLFQVWMLQSKTMDANVWRSAQQSKFAFRGEMPICIKVFYANFKCTIRIVMCITFAAVIKLFVVTFALDF